VHRFARQAVYILVILVCFSLNSCAPAGLEASQMALASRSGLSIEEHALKAIPQVEPLTFVPLQGTQEEILRKHQVQRDEVLSQKPPSEWIVQVGGDKVTATSTVATGNGGGEASVEVSRNGEVVYVAQIGPVGPVPYLRGLWAYANHWVLEVARIGKQTSQWRARGDKASGEIIQDGVSLNTQHGYQETFGFQLIKGKPFYFFRKLGKLGVAYDGQEILLGYTQVPHYLCCSAAGLNPKRGRDMVAFFARRNGWFTPADAGWCYVEIGAFYRGLNAGLMMNPC